MKRIKSVYSVTFDSTTRCWTKSRKLNVMFLLCVQRSANNLMRTRHRKLPDGTITRGYVFLNEIFAMLCMPPTKVGACVGWMCDENDPIDFEINIRGTNPNVVLDFNVKNICDYIS